MEASKNRHRESSSLPWNLHDYMSLGEVEKGLSLTTNAAAIEKETLENGSSESSSSSSPLATVEALEIGRLPTFLRLLSKTRNLVSLSILDKQDTEENNNSNKNTDPLVQRTVERLEHVAAIHSIAEGVDVVTCYLVPSITQRLSQVGPLVKRRTGTFDTRELEKVARNPKGPPTTLGNNSSNGRLAKKTKVDEEQGENTTSTAALALHESEDDVDDDDDNDKGLEEDGLADHHGDEQMANSGSRKRKRKRGGRSDDVGENRRTSLEVAAEDSQEATVVKTLSELISLVATSLEPIVVSRAMGDDHGDHHHHHHHHDNGGGKHNGDATDGGHGGDAAELQQPTTQFTLGGSARKGQFALTIDDSILAETGRDGTGGAMELSDLGSTVAAIMHHAPVLQFRHVANALCRASIPQVSNLMNRMGANCPASVASLLSGCIEAYQVATQLQHASITNVAKQGVLALANLSPTETSRVLLKLQTTGIMWDVQLELAIQEPVVNVHAAPSLLVRQTYGATSTPTSTPSAIEVPIPRPMEREQSTGEEPNDDFRVSEPSDAIHGRNTTKEPSLPALLGKRPLLYRNTLDFFAKHLELLSQQNRFPRGQLLLLLKALSCLLLIPGLSSPSPKFYRSRHVYKKLLPSLASLAEKVLKLLLQMKIDSDLPATSSADSLVEMLYGVVLLSSARIFEGLRGDESAVETCQELHVLLGELPSPSRRVQSFRRSMEKAISNEWIQVVYGHIAGTIASQILGSDVETFSEAYADIETGLRDVCSLLKSPSTMDRPEEGEGETLGDLTTTIQSLMLVMEKGPSGDKAVKDSIKDALAVLLTNERVDIRPSLQTDLLARFVSKATQILLRGDEDESLAIPFILSVSLERQGSALYGCGDLKSIGEASAKFLIQLLHAFEFLNAKPKSPFAFDPRSVPLKEALRVATLLSDHHFLRTRLYELARVHCLDILLQQERKQVIGLGENSIYNSMTRRQALQSFYSALQSYVNNLEKDSEATGSEITFLQAKAVFSDADLCTTVCSALMASPHNPKPTISYHVLCRDPLVLFKCPLKIWRCRGLRRTILAVFSMLLESNAFLVHRDSRLESSAEELLAARNVIVVRCLLMCVCGVETDVGPTDCTMMSSFIRSIISGQGGVVAALIKQGLSERAVDWLVEYVPECMNDSHDMMHLLSDRSSLTAAERLVAADTVLRIAIVHGQNQDENAASMAYAALSQLVDSFFLVVGPVGVPVNALIVDDSGTDVTTISRKAAFRILKALNRVRGRRLGLRKECAMALQKLAGLCKSESAVAGVAGAVAGRRKALLKEMYDLIVKAATTMGGTGNLTAAGQS